MKHFADPGMHDSPYGISEPGVFSLMIETSTFPLAAA